MSILVFPRLSPFTSLPHHKCSSISGSISARRIRCCSKSNLNVASKTSGGGGGGGAAVVWFKQDLRVDDHDGLVLAAARHSSVVPLYVFDHRLISHFNDEMLELLLIAVKDLRLSLNNLGSDLMIRFGKAEYVIQEIVKEVRPASIYAEEEVEYNLRSAIELVKETLASLLLVEGSPGIILWTTHFYDLKNMVDLPASFGDFERLKCPVLPPVLPPKLPDKDMSLAWGSLPTLDDLKSFINENPGKVKDSWISIKNISAADIIRRNQAVKYNRLDKGLGIPKSAVGTQNNLNGDRAGNRRQNTAFVTKQGNLVGGGTNSVLNALAAYLRYLEGTGRDDWQEVHEKLRNTESREGASFGALFGSSLQLGIISRRRVYYEAIKYERDRNGGFLSPFGYSATTIAAAVNHVCSAEWSWLVAQRSQMHDAKMTSVRFWRWNSYLIQYAVAGHEGPATLLVHGFGAFWEHYRDNINDIAKSGNRVWAITLLGFGRSEKPNVVYTELMWAELLRDFTVEVVGEPVHIVGNSFGGYFAAILAGCWPALARSVVLLNSAGHIVPGYSLMPPFKVRRTSGLAWLGGRFLLFFLRGSLRNIVRSCYPNKVERADDWLIYEMLRASYDPGVILVLESIFTFDPSIPLNYLLKGIEEKVLVIQGMNDPIANSKSQVALFREHCKGIAVKEVEAGHCPHDEVPEEVNSIIAKWVVNVESGNINVNGEDRDRQRVEFLA